MGKPVKSIRMSFRLALTTLSFIVCSISYAQDKKVANQYFQMGNFEDALEEYKLLVEAAPEEVEYQYRLGICYLNTNIDKAKALPYMQFVVKQPKHDPNAVYLLGRAYHYAYEFDNAIKSYQQFQDAKAGSDENIADVAKQIEYCQNAIELIKFPVDVTFENVGEQVNSAYADYYPFVPVDESFVLFNTKRDDGSMQMEDGRFTSNIYISNVKDGKFSKAKLAGEIVNTPNNNEEIVGLSSNGDNALLYFDSDRGFGEVYISRVVNGAFDKPAKLDKSINSKATEIAASISSKGDAIYFASNREGGFGGVDLYVSRRLPNGSWSPAQNLGPSINTPDDEDFPTISPDGKTLYFSSKGHTSMGGYDIFTASWDQAKSKFSGVRNMGFPINTPEDNMNFRVSATGRFGYIAALREEGYGDLDIYRVTFNEVEPRYTVIAGHITADGGKEVVDPFIAVWDNETGEEYGNYLPNPKTMRYVIILPPGNFTLSVDAPGFNEYTEDINVMDKSSYKAELKRDITLK